MSQPVEMVRDQEFALLPVMRRFHCDQSGGQAVALGERANMRGVVVCHEKIAPEFCDDVKQTFMVDVRVFVEAAACNRIWWVYETGRCWVIHNSGQCLQSVALNESKP